MNKRAIGKTALVRRFGHLIRGEGAFISSGFGPHRSDEPYEPLVRALRQLVQRMLGESERQLNRWRRKLRRTLGAGSSWLLQRIPELRVLLGQARTSAVGTALSEAEGARQFKAAFLQLIRICCSGKQPLILFFDDIHRADAAMRELLAAVAADPRGRGLLIIAAWRDEEQDNQPDDDSSNAMRLAPDTVLIGLEPLSPGFPYARDYDVSRFRVERTRGE
ncbi:AAA family ATPase [Cohnella hongkongensis]|uniref:AAA family ATPase n=1 Tax=Cohnella hongkongensis TaxID=178337 RepID=A0ABV9FJ93_9BACL